MKGVSDEVIRKYKAFVSGAEHIYEEDLVLMTKLHKKKKKILKELFQVENKIIDVDYYLTFRG